MQRIYVSNIAGGTSQEELENFFSKLGGTVDVYKGTTEGLRKPYAFVLLPKETFQAQLEAEHTLGAQKLVMELPKNYIQSITKKFYLDCRETKGAIAALSEETVKKYFSTYGEVTRVNLMGPVGKGFVDIKDPDNNPKVAEIPWRNHVIDGHEINVQESQDRKDDPRKRKRRWGGWRKTKKAKQT